MMIHDVSLFIISNQNYLNVTDCFSNESIALYCCITCTLYLLNGVSVIQCKIHSAFKQLYSIRISQNSMIWNTIKQSLKKNLLNDPEILSFFKTIKNNEEKPLKNCFVLILIIYF